MRKITNIIILVCFLVTSCFGDAFGEVCHAQGGVRPVTIPAYEQFDFDAFHLPRGLGEIKDAWKTSETIGKEDRVVIHIQDAHCNYDAQKKISDIIEYLHNNYGVSTINLEGGEGAYDLAAFTDIQDKVVREKVADYFVRQGLVNGAEYYAINNGADSQVKLWGIEDTDLYLENLNVYRDFLKHKQRAELYLKQIESVLNALKKNIYSDALLEFDEQYAQYKESTLELKDYIAYLSRKAHKKTLNTKFFPNVYLLAKSLEEENNIDFKRAEKEREILIYKLGKRLSKNSLKELLEKTAALKKKEEPDELFYNFLIKKAKTVNISIKRFPELKKYVRYITLYNAMDKTCLLEEIERLEDEIKESMYETDAQRELNRLSKTLTLTKNLFNIQLSKRDYEYYKTHQADFRVEKYISFIKKEAVLNKINDEFSPNLHKLDKWRNDLSMFYECSTKRDGAFLKNLSLNTSVPPRRWKRTPPTRRNSQAPFTIIITGGFHTENLSALFKKNNISYVTIMPNFKNGKNYQSQYFNLLAGRQIDTLKTLVTENLNLALYTDFCENVVKVYSIDEIEAKTLWRQLAQAVFEEKKDITIHDRRYSFEPKNGAIPIVGLKIDGMPVYVKTVFSQDKKELSDETQTEKFSSKARSTRQKGNTFLNSIKLISMVVILYLTITMIGCAGFRTVIYDGIDSVIHTRTAKYERTVNIGERPVKIFFKNGEEYLPGLEDAISDVMTNLPQSHTEWIKKIVIGSGEKDGNYNKETGQIQINNDYDAMYFPSNWLLRLIVRDTDILLKKAKTTHYFIGCNIHEVGHRVYRYRLTREEKELWKKLHRDSSKDEFCSYYAETNAEEDFTETYRMYVQDSVKLLREAHGKLGDKFAFMARRFMKPDKKGNLELICYRSSLDYLHNDSKTSYIIPEKVLIKLSGVFNPENIKFSHLKKEINKHTEGTDKPIYISDLFSKNEIKLVHKWFNTRYKWDTWALGFIQSFSLKECNKLAISLEKLSKKIEEQNVATQNLKFYLDKKRLFGSLDTKLFLKDIRQFKDGVSEINLFSNRHPNVEIIITPWVLSQYDIAVVLDDIEYAWEKNGCDDAMKTRIHFECIDVYSDSIEGFGLMGAPGMSKRLFNITIGRFSSYTDGDINEKNPEMIPGTDRFRELLKRLVRKNIEIMDRLKSSTESSQTGQTITKKPTPGDTSFQPQDDAIPATGLKIDGKKVYTDHAGIFNKGVIHGWIEKVFLRIFEERARGIYENFVAPLWEEGVYFVLVPSFICLVSPLAFTYAVMLSRIIFVGAHYFNEGSTERFVIPMLISAFVSIFAAPWGMGTAGIMIAVRIHILFNVITPYMNRFLEKQEINLQFGKGVIKDAQDPIEKLIGYPDYLSQGMWKIYKKRLNDFTGHKQGWKLHVAATVDNAEKIAKLVKPILHRYNVMHKFASNLACLEWLNTPTREEDKTQIGKFIAIYTDSKEQADSLVSELDSVLSGRGFKTPDGIIWDAKGKRADKWAKGGKSGLVGYRYGSYTDEEIILADGRITKDIRTGYKHPLIKETLSGIKELEVTDLNVMESILQHNVDRISLNKLYWILMNMTQGGGGYDVDGTPQRAVPIYLDSQGRVLGIGSKEGLNIMNSKKWSKPGELYGAYLLFNSVLGEGEKPWISEVFWEQGPVPPLIYRVITDTMQRVNKRVEKLFLKLEKEPKKEGEEEPCLEDVRERRLIYAMILAFSDKPNNICKASNILIGLAADNVVPKVTPDAATVYLDYRKKNINFFKAKRQEILEELIKERRKDVAIKYFGSSENSVMNRLIRDEKIIRKIANLSDKSSSKIAHDEGMPLETSQPISKNGIWDIGEIKKSVMRDAVRLAIGKTIVFIDNDLIQQHKAFGFEGQESFVEFLNDFFTDEISMCPIEQEKLVISVLDTAGYLFEDHLANGFIGIHRSLFEKLGSSPQTARGLLAVGLKHELSHEALFVEREVLIENSLNADEFIHRNRADIKKAMQKIGLWQEVEKRMLEEDIRNAEDMALDVRGIISSGLLAESAPFVAGMVGGSFNSEEIDKKSLQKPPPGTDEEIEQVLIDPAEVVRDDGWRPLANTVSFMREVLNSPLKFEFGNEEYLGLCKNKAFQEASQDIFEGIKMIPARIDTYIFNQSPYKEQALVELIANAQDASIEKKSIGRFGAGFYQVFQELYAKGGGSVVVTTSSDGIRALRVEFTLVDGEVCYKEPEVITENVVQGTKIEVARSLSPEEIDDRIKYAKSKLKANTRGKILVNGCWINDVSKYRYINGDILSILPNVPSVEVEINKTGYTITDTGRGISPKVLFEKLLTPKESVNAMEGAPKEKSFEVREETKIFYSNVIKGEGKGIVSIQVSGVINIDIPVFGMNLPEEMILELPHDAWLPESRDDIALDEMTKEGLLAAAKKITDLNRKIEDRYSLLNALAVLFKELTKDTEDKTLLYELKKLCGALIEKEKALGKIILPNKKDFTKLLLPQDKKDDVIYLDEGLSEFQVQSLPGAKRVRNFSSKTHVLYTADLDTSGGNDIYLEGKYANEKGWIIVDKTIWNKDKDPALIDLLLNLGVSYGDRGKNLGRVITEPNEKTVEDTTAAKSTTSAPFVRNGVNEEKVIAIMGKVFSKEIEMILDSFEEDDREFIRQKAEEAVRGGMITEENISEIVSNFKTWLDFVVKMKNVVSKFSVSALRDSWVAKEFFCRNITIFEGNQNLVMRKVRDKIYFWNDTFDMESMKLFEMDLNGEISLIGEKMKPLFVGDDVYFWMRDGARGLQLRNKDNQILLYDIIKMGESDNNSELIAVTYEDNSNKVKINVVRKGKISEFCEINLYKAKEFLPPKGTPLIGKRGEYVFIVKDKNSAQDVYRIDSEGQVVKVDWGKYSMAGMGTISDIKGMQNGSFMVSGKFPNMLDLLINKTIEKEFDIFLFDDDGVLIKDPTGVGNSIKPQEEIAKKYDGYIYFVEFSFLKRWKDGKDVEIFVENRGFMAVGMDEARTLQPPLNSLQPMQGEIMDIQVFGNDVYITENRKVLTTTAPSPVESKRVIKCSLEDGRCVLTGKCADVAWAEKGIRAGNELFYVLEGKNTFESVIVMIGEDESELRVDFKNDIKDIRVVDGKLYVTEQPEFKVEASWTYAKNIIYKISSKGRKKPVYEIEGYFLDINEPGGKEADSRFIFRRINKSLTKQKITLGSEHFETIVFDATTEKETRIKGYHGGIKDALINNNIVHVDNTKITLCPTFNSAINSQELFGRNLEKLEKSIPQIGKFIPELREKEISQLISTLQTRKNWMPACIFLHENLDEEGMDKLEDVFDEIFQKAKNVKEIRTIFSFIDDVLWEVDDKDAALGVLKRWMRIFSSNRELADIVSEKMQERISVDSGGVPISLRPLTIYYSFPSVLNQLSQEVHFFLNFLVQEKITPPKVIKSGHFKGEKIEGEILKNRPLAALMRLRQKFPEEIMRRDVSWSAVTDKIKGIKDEDLGGIKREITGAVNGQDKKQMFFLREFGQNARDAIRTMLGIKVKSGFLGHGFYTGFAGKCDEIRIVTGNGKETYELVLIPEYDAKEDLTDVQIKTMTKYRSKYKGTRIEKAEFFESQADMDAMIKIMYSRYQAKKFLGAVPAKGAGGVTFLFNDEVINEDGYLNEDPNRIVRITSGMTEHVNDKGYYEWIASCEDPAGMDFFTILNKLLPPDVSGKPSQKKIGAADIGKDIKASFSKDGTTRANVDGLYVDKIDTKYTRLVPESVKKILLKKGWNIEFPAGTPVPRTRKGVIDPRQYEKWIAVSAFKALVELYVKDKDVEIPLLPKDYVYSRKNIIEPERDIARDAEMIKNDYPEGVDFEKYLKDPFALAQLLTVIKVTYDGKEFSLNEVKKRVLKEYEKEDGSKVDLDGILPPGMEDQKDMAESQIRGKIDAVEADIDDLLEEPVVSVFRSFFDALNRLTGSEMNACLFSCIYNTKSVAAGDDGYVDWNLAHHSWILTPLIDFIISGDTGGKFQEFIDTYIHETAHTKEHLASSKYKKDSTHEAEQGVKDSFGWIMKKLLTGMIKEIKPLKEFRQEFRASISYSDKELKVSHDKVIEKIKGRREKPPITGNVIKGFTPEEEAELRVGIMANSGAVMDQNMDIVDIVDKRCHRLLKFGGNIEFLLRTRGIPENQISRVISALKVPHEAFQWFNAIVKSEDKYLLGHESALAVNLIRYLMVREKLEGIGDLVDEYILHEALENIDWKGDERRDQHHKIIDFTNLYFRQGKYEDTGQTSLGRALATFIDISIRNKGTINSMLRVQPANVTPPKPVEIIQKAESLPQSNIAKAGKQAVFSTYYDVKPIFKPLIPKPPIPQFGTTTFKKMYDNAKDRKMATIKAFNSEPPTKTRDPIAIVGLPAWMKGKVKLLRGLKMDISRALGRAGHGKPNDPHKVDFFFMGKDKLEETETSITNILRKYRDRKSVLFIPEMPGLKIKSDSAYVNDLKKEFKGALTIVADAYNDLDFSVEKKFFVDIDARIAITRLIGYYREAEGYEASNKLEAQRNAMRALTEYLVKITGEEVKEKEDLNKLLENLLLKIRPIDYNGDIGKWETAQKALATSL